MKIIHDDGQETIITDKTTIMAILLLVIGSLSAKKN